MNIITFFSKITLVSLLIIASSSAEIFEFNAKSAHNGLAKLNIICILNSKFKGDTDQIKGIERALTAQAKAQHFKVNTIEVESTNISSILSVFEAGTKNIVISSNDYGVNALKELQANKKSFYGLLTSHQYFDGLKSAIKQGKESGITFVALPGHALTWRIKKNIAHASVKLIETVGVAQNLLPEECDKSYATHSSDIKGSADPSTKYLLVFLGGDAQKSNEKNWAYYTSKEAEKLAKFVASTAKRDNLIVLITNGPRTGKFDPKTGQENPGHRDDVIDYVSLKFIEALKQQQLPENQYQLFDFQYGKASDFNRLVGAVRAHAGSQVLIEGSSTSVISQSIVNFNANAPVSVYQHKAMTKVHHQHVQQEYDAGRISLLTQEMILLPSKNRKDKGLIPAEDMIAKTILKEINR